jgi:hypothetical protein
LSNGVASGLTLIFILYYCRYICYINSNSIKQQSVFAAQAAKAIVAHVFDGAAADDGAAGKSASSKLLMKSINTVRAVNRLNSVSQRGAGS